MKKTVVKLAALLSVLVPVLLGCDSSSDSSKSGSSSYDTYTGSSSYDSSATSDTSGTQTAQDKYSVGQRVTATDVFGNTVTGYIAYVRPEGSTTFLTDYTVGFSTSSASYAISNAGGKSWKYLVAVMNGTSDSSSYMYKNLAWAPDTTTNVSGLSEAVGAGKANTDAIISAYTGATTGNCAAKALKDANNCYLPSVGEMAVIYQNLFYSDKVAPPTYNTGIVGSVSYYYTSNQASSESPDAYARVFNMYKGSLTGGKDTDHTKAVSSTAAWFVCTLGVTYLAE